MSLDLRALCAAIKAHGRVARVVIAAVRGSAPREVGASILVWRQANGTVAQSGTIGGGALELLASQTAFDRRGAEVHPLGPKLGQCCGGAVTLWTEQFDRSDLSRLAEAEACGLFLRSAGKASDKPLAVQRLLDQARGQGQLTETQLVQGWLAEPVLSQAQALPVWIWGAGHVGRALVTVLAPLPEIRITWADTASARFPAGFPDTLPDGVVPLITPDLPGALARAPKNAAHLILTYSHEIDFGLCHAALRHGFGFCGLIGSDSKWRRFSSRLAGLGHNPDDIGDICCPIGQKALGKHPQAIAIGAAAQIIALKDKDRKGDRWPKLCSTSGA